MLYAYDESMHINPTTEVSEIQGEKPQKRSTPTYSPNAWAELAHFLVRDPSCEYFRTHRGDFLISSSEPRYEPKIDIFGTPIRPLKNLQMCPYLDFQDKIRKSPRCV